LRHFPAERLLVLVYEDALTDPVSYVQRVYRFLEVDAGFVATMVRSRINEGRVPVFSAFDRLMARTSEVAVRSGLARLWWHAKRAGVGRLLRRINTRQTGGQGPDPDLASAIRATLGEETRGLQELLGRDLREWTA
jgi:hypothetical protein